MDYGEGAKVLYNLKYKSKYLIQKGGMKIQKGDYYYSIEKENEKYNYSIKPKDDGIEYKMIIGQDEELKMQLYGLKSQAVKGNCNMPMPPMTNPLLKSKWNSWTACKNMTEIDAMKEYLVLYNEYKTTQKSKSPSKKNNNNNNTSDSNNNVSLSNNLIRYL